jgi:hypothetical protein
MAPSGTGDRGEMHFALRLGNVPLGRVARVIRRVHANRSLLGVICAWER